MTAGCSSGDEADDREVFLTYRSHPLRADGTELQCHRDGQCALFTRGQASHVEAFVSSASLDRVSGALEAAGFSDLQSTARNDREPGAYTILFEGHRVAGSDTRPVPELDGPRAQLDALVTQVREGRFQQMLSAMP